MKGTVHAAIGASAPAGLIFTSHVTVPQGATMAVVSAGFALLPDLDTPRSTASVALGRTVHRSVHKLSSWVLFTTATGRDKSDLAWRQRMQGWCRDPVHRTLTHTLAATFVVGAGAYLAFLLSTTAAAILAALGVFLLWPIKRKAIPLVVVGAAAAAVATILLLTPWLLALAVGGGYLSHVAADACTKSGVPALWPARVKNKRWWNIRVLGSLVSSGSSRERGPAVGVSLASNGLLLFLML